MGCFFSCNTCTAKSFEYSNLKNNLKTGDIILFSGTGIQSFEAKCGTCSPFSHIGMIIRSSHLNKNEQKGNKLFLWHAPAQTLPFAPDQLTNQIKDGPQLNKLYPALCRASGKIYLRKIKKNGRSSSLMSNTSLGDPFESGLLAYMKRAQPKSYEKNIKELILSAYDGPWGENEQNLTSYFCSELVAETYKVMGLLSSNEPSNEYVPSDFAKDIYLTRGYYLANLVRIKLS